MFLKYAKLPLAATILAAMSFNVHAENVPDNIPGSTKVDGSKVIEMLGDMDDLVVIDARGNGREKTGWIPGSVHVPFGKGFDTKESTAKLVKILGDKSTPWVAFCNGERCDRSFHAIKAGLKAGYKNAYWYRSGWDSWVADGYPVEK
jgi:rhodanese-related sulfurtransferase